MAEITGRTNSAGATKEYATDELGMMADAKEYAKRDFDVCRLVVAKVNGVELSKEDEAKIAEALIQVKYEQIKNARLNRVSYFD